ncbi:hypothetical protein D3C86_2230540 [compost metagenome]
MPAASRSLNVRIFEVYGTAITEGTEAKVMTALKSAFGSNCSFLNTLGLMAKLLLTISRV